VRKPACRFRYKGRYNSCNQRHFPSPPDANPPLVLLGLAFEARPGRSPVIISWLVPQPPATRRRRVCSSYLTSPLATFVQRSVSGEKKISPQYCRLRRWPAIPPDLLRWSNRFYPRRYLFSLCTTPSLFPLFPSLRPGAGQTSKSFNMVDPVRAGWGPARARCRSYPLALAT